MVKLKVLLIAFFIGLAVVAAPAASADTKGSGSPNTILCTTTHYDTDAGMPIYNGPGTDYGVLGYTANNWVVNVTGFAGDWRGGYFYTADRVRYNNGWIHLSHVHYWTCW